MVPQNALPTTQIGKATFSVSPGPESVSSLLPPPTNAGSGSGARQEHATYRQATHRRYLAIPILQPIQYKFNVLKSKVNIQYTFIRSDKLQSYFWASPSLYHKFTVHNKDIPHHGDSISHFFQNGHRWLKKSPEGVNRLRMATFGVVCFLHFLDIM